MNTHQIRVLHLSIVYVCDCPRRVECWPAGSTGCLGAVFAGECSLSAGLVPAILPRLWEPVDQRKVWCGFGSASSSLDCCHEPPTSHLTCLSIPWMIVGFAFFLSASRSGCLYSPDYLLTAVESSGTMQCDLSFHQSCRAPVDNRSMDIYCIAGLLSWKLEGLQRTECICLTLQPNSDWASQAT